MLWVGTTRDCERKISSWKFNHSDLASVSAGERGEVYATVASFRGSADSGRTPTPTTSQRGLPTTSALTFPTPPGSALSGSSVTFQWSPGTGVTAYMLWVGTTGMGAKDLYAGSSTTAASTGVTVPTNGAKVYARLFSEISGVWSYVDTTYIEAGAPAPAAITPRLRRAGSLSGSSVTFQWLPGAGVGLHALGGKQRDWIEISRWKFEPQPTPKASPCPPTK